MDVHGDEPEPIQAEQLELTPPVPDEPEGIQGPRPIYIHELFSFPDFDLTVLATIPSDLHQPIRTYLKAYQQNGIFPLPFCPQYSPIFIFS